LKILAPICLLTISSCALTIHFDPCDLDRADCNGRDEDGCEVDLKSDPHHCGWCRHDCLGGSCDQGFCEPTVLAEGVNMRGIATDDQNVYWLDGPNCGPASVMTIRKDGVGGARQFFDAGGFGVSLTIADRELYWLLREGAVVKAPLDGGQAAQALTTPAGLAPYDLVTNGAYAVWYACQEDACPSPGDRPCTSGQQPTPKHIQVQSLNASTVREVASSFGAIALNMDRERVYWSDRAGFQGLWFAPIVNGTAVLVSDEWIDAFAVTDGMIYWSTSMSFLDGSPQCAIRVGSTSGPGSLVLETSYPFCPKSLLQVDVTGMYWLDENLSVRALPRAPEDPPTSFGFPGCLEINALAADASAFYLTCSDRLVRLGR